MALIIKCRSCKKRVPEEAATCTCGSDQFRFVVDYWPNGRYGGRKQITLDETVRTVEDARALERSFVSARKKSPSVTKTSLRSTVKDLFPDYLDWYHQHRAESTWKDLSRTWEARLKQLMGNYRVIDVSTEHYALYQSYRGKKVKARTVNKELDYFSGFLRWCRKVKKIDVPPIDYDRLPSRRPLPLVLSPDEVARILVEAEKLKNPIYYTLILCWYAVGLRSAEARNLKWDDIDEANQTVRVTQKGGTQKILPINGELIEAFRRVLTYKKAPPGHYVFSFRKDGSPVHNIRGTLNQIVAAAGVKKTVTPHLFRHSIATHLLTGGVNQRTIQRYLGHSSSAATEWYTHVSLEHLRAAQEGLYRKTE